MTEKQSDHRAAMASLVREAALALSLVDRYWTDNKLPSDFSTPETGYPFAQSLDDQVAAILGWADRLEGAE